MTGKRNPLLMIFSKPDCPICSEKARGTVETLSACALLTFGNPPSNAAQYFGQTDVWWDEQKPATNRRGQWRLICPSGHEWWSRVT